MHVPALDDDRAYVVAAHETLAPELTGRHENANCHASPDCEATLRRSAPQRLDSYAGVMDSARRAPSKFARRPSRGDASRTLKEKETKKETAARSARLSSDHRRAASARDHGGEAEFAISDSYCGRHDNNAWCGRFESALRHRLENPAAMRDFGHRSGETRTRTGDTTIFSRARRSGLRPKSLVVAWCPPVCGYRKMFAVCGYVSPFVGMAGASGSELGLAPWGCIRIRA
jgi:hypothetical protein